MTRSISAVHGRIGTLLAAAAVALAGVVAGATPAQAEVAGSQFQISSSASDYVPATAYDSTNDQHLVVWLDQSTTTNRIMGQLVSSSDAMVGSSIVVTTFPTGYWWTPPSVAYNPTNDEFLVVWNKGNLIYAQRIASDGTLVGDPVSLATLTYNSTPDMTSVVWSPDAAKYLVAWDGSTTTSDWQIYGRMVAGDGTPAGDSEVQLSHASSIDGDWAWQVDVAYNTVDQEFLVAWVGLTDSREQIWGQRVGTDGTPVSTTDVKISSAPFGDAVHPAIAFDATNDQYLVVFSNPTVSTEGAFEVFGQRVAADMTMNGSTFQISNLANYDVAMGVLTPVYAAGVTGVDVAFDPDTNRFLTVFSEGTTYRFSRWADKEVYGDYISTAGALVGTRDFQISDFGAWRDLYSNALRPAVDFNSTTGEFMAVWFGATEQGSLTVDDFNVWGSRVDGSEGTLPEDTTAPPTAINLITFNGYPMFPNDAGWFGGTQTPYVTVRAFDGLLGSGVDEVRCALDPESVPATFADLPAGQCSVHLVSTEGQHTLYAASIDNSGNAGDVVSKDIWIDRTAPSLAPSVSPSSTLLLNQSGATAAANATDALSGVDTSGCDPVDTSTLGQHSVACSATDVAGNNGTGSATYLVAYKAAFVSPTAGASYAAGKAVPVEVTLSDYNDVGISTADGLAIARAGQLTVSASGAVSLGATAMKYARNTGSFTFRLRIPRTASAGAIVITLTTHYAGTSLTATTTRTIYVV